MTLKLILLALALVLVAFVGGLVGPGPLVPGLGPALGQLWPIALVIVPVSATLPWLLQNSRKLQHQDNASSEISQPERILRERYARGELDRSQFLFMLDDVRSPHPRKT